MDNFEDFSKGVDEFISDEVPDAFIDLKNVITLDLFAGLTALSPVDTGRFRYGWSTSLDTPSKFIPEEGLTKYPAPDEGAALSPLRGQKAYQFIWLTNNLPYAGALNDGHSKQAPKGWVDLEVERVRSGI